MTSHYKVHKPEAIDLILKYDLNFVEGNVVKYILRSPFKGDSEGDLNKALYYARLLKPSDCRRVFKDDFHEYKELSTHLRAAIVHTIESDISNDRYLTSEKIQNYVAYCIEIAIQSRSRSCENKEFNPDWLPPHPLSTLIDLIDEDPKKILSKLYKIEDRAIIEEKDRYYLYRIALIRSLIQGDCYIFEILSEIAGIKEYWQNKYINYWKAREK